MRWDEERYIRLYKTDTADWLALSFDAQALFVLLLRKVNLSGHLALGRHGPKAIAMVLQQVALWESRLKPALEELIADGCVRIDGTMLVMPNFVAAQSARMSDKLRSSIHRERKDLREAENKAATARDEVSTQRSENVTRSHAASHGVTPLAFNQPLARNKQIPPIPPETARGAESGTRFVGDSEQPPCSPLNGNGTTRAPRLKTRKRHQAGNLTLRQELQFREDEKRDQRSKALFAWLESERQGPQVLNEAQDGLVRLPGREPSREERIAFVREKFAATAEEAEDAVALVEHAQAAAKVGRKPEAQHA